MSNYMKKMGANPETLEEFQDKLIGELLMVIRWKEEGEIEQSREWVSEVVKPLMYQVEVMKPAHWGTKCMECYDDDLAFDHRKLDDKMKFQERKELYKELLKEHQVSL